MLPPLPRRSDWAWLLRSSTQSCQPSPVWQPGRPAHRPFRGLLGVHSRCGLHTRAATKSWLALPEGFSHFVTSMTAPVASGWSVRRVGFAPTEKRRLITAHANAGRSALRCIADLDRCLLAKTRHSTTLSARRRIESGNLIPSAFAALMFITNSNLVGCSIGRSAGFAPLRILST